MPHTQSKGGLEMTKRLVLILSLISIIVFSSCTKTQTETQTQDPIENVIANDGPLEKALLLEHKFKVHTSQNIEGTTNNNSQEPSGLSNKEINWGFKPNSNHTVPSMPSNVIEMLSKYAGYYVGDTKSKVVYLTYDEGYENGYTPKILDVLKANDVKAAFFVVKPYINSNPDIIKRMVDEGHIVANHSSKHPAMPERANNSEAFTKEFTEVEEAFKEITGKDMPKYFRPPMGKFSEKTLSMTQQLGYKTIFWSLAHVDWDVNNQPPVQKTHDTVLERVHDGSIILLHAVSKSNTEALDSIIKDLKAQGYRFGTLDELK
jgi:peptidoglycan-N-acetylmuramic acid deacetylase